jgi:REP element-mobilizing transposase RayT
MGILAFELISANYGFWLPNDERGSCSDFVRSDALTKFGPANPVSHRRSVAWKPFDIEMRELAQASLKYDPVVFNEEQILAVGRGMGSEIKRYGGVIHAAAIMPRHTHLVVGPPRYDIRRFSGRLKGAATKQLIAEGIHPLANFPNEDGSLPSPWSVKPWVVYLFSNDDVVRANDYTVQNLVKARRPPQYWKFITEYAGRPRTRGAAHHR